MLAVAVRGPGLVGLENRQSPSGEESGAVLVQMERMGICGTDLAILDGSVPVSYPRILGHELVGRVLRPGARGQLSEGQRVLVNPALSCGMCRECRADRANLCPNGGLMGRDVDGGFTESILVDESRLLPIPDDCSAAAASSLQVLGTCVHGQSFLSVMPGQTAVVVGLGVSGFIMLQLLVARGLRVVGVTRARWKRELALHFGAVDVATPETAAAAVSSATSGVGADVTVEAVGTPQTIADAILHAAPGGQVLLFGTTSTGGSALPMYELYYKELTIHSPRAALQRDYAVAIDLVVQGRVDLDPLCTHTYPLHKAAEAFDVLRSDSRALKVALRV